MGLRASIIEAMSDAARRAMFMKLKHAGGTGLLRIPAVKLAMAQKRLAAVVHDSAVLSKTQLPRRIRSSHMGGIAGGAAEKVKLIAMARHAAIPGGREDVQKGTGTGRDFDAHSFRAKTARGKAANLNYRRYNPAGDASNKHAPVFKIRDAFIPARAQTSSPAADSKLLKRQRGLNKQVSDLHTAAAALTAAKAHMQTWFRQNPNKVASAVLAAMPAGHAKDVLLGRLDRGSLRYEGIPKVVHDWALNKPDSHLE